MSIYIKDKNGEIKKVGMVTNVEMTLDDMWDYIQSFGQRTSYTYFSNILWTAKNFKPRYDIRPTEAYQFLKNTHGSIGINKLLTDGQVNMKKLEEERGIVFDFSKCDNLELGFANGLFSELNVINVSKAKLNYGFYNGYLNGTGDELKLKRIEHLICSENTTFYSNTFSYCNRLEYIGFEGVIAKNGLSVADCTVLAKECLIALINCLKDYSEDTSGTAWKITLGANNLAKLTEEEKQMITDKGWDYE